MTRKKCAGCRRDAHPCYGSFCEDCWVTHSKTMNDDNGWCTVSTEGCRPRSWGGDRHRAGISPFDPEAFSSSEPFVSISAVDQPPDK